MTSEREWARSVFIFRVGDSTFADRFPAMRQWINGGEGRSNEKLARAAGLSESAVKSWGSRGSDLKLATAEALSRNTGLSLDYIARGEPRTQHDFEVEMLRFELAKKAFPIPSSYPERRAARQEVLSEAQRQLDELAASLAEGRLPAGAEIAMLPRLAVEASAGHGRNGLSESATAELVPFRRDWLRERGINPAFAQILTNRGDSMLELEDGAPMLVDTEPGKPIVSGYIYVFVLEGDLLVKRLSRNLDGTIDLLSSNPLYPKQTITQDRLDRLVIAGRVHWTGHWL